MSLPEVTDVQRLRLKPGDSLVIRCSERLDMAQAAYVKEQVKAILRLADDVPVLVLPDGMAAEVLSPPVSAGVPAACEGRAPAGAPVPGSPVNPAREVG